MAFDVGKIITFLKEARRELSKVVWPSKKDILKHTIIVIVISLSLAGLFGALDAAFTFAIQKLI
ncbi:preprotein translocase subunit SecE [Patescibacteria group bacterium]